MLFSDVGVLTPDTKPEVFLAPWETARRLSGWWIDSPFLGVPNFNVGLAPVAAALGLIEVVVPSPWLAMRVWRLLLLLLAAWGARRFFGELVGSTPRMAAVGRIVIAVVYVANPYLLLGGNSTPTLLPLALLPWFGLFALRLLTRPSSRLRWGAASALSLAAMSGVNVGVVVVAQLIVLVPLLAHATVVCGVSLRSALLRLAGVGVSYLVMSLYWILPAVSALGVGQAVAGGTESMGSINAANSYAEVLRGLGYWPLYGGDGRGPFLPGIQSLVTNPLVVLATFGLPVLALIGARYSRSPARLFGSVSVVIGAVVMVGAFPFDHPSATGRASLWAFANVPGAIALRTTNKAGAVLELGLSVLIALGAMYLAHRFPATTRHPVVARRVVTAAVALVAAVSVLPALVGNLFLVRLDLPSYWEEAAHTVNSESARDRVMLTPGIALADYSWGYSGPDELTNSLIDREALVRISTPMGNQYASGLLSAVDEALYQGNLPPGAMSQLAAYTGVGELLARYDRSLMGERGSTVDQQLAADPGLKLLGAYGPADVAAGADHPVKRYGVTAASGEPPVWVGGSGLLVDGDGSALGSLSQASLIDNVPALLMAGSMQKEQVRSALGDGAKVVLTDGNRRRQQNGGKPEVGGPLLPSSEDPGATWSVFGGVDQTVAEYEGAQSVTTAGDGLLFGPFPGGDAALALDGDRSTAWRFGNFGTARGNAVTIKLKEPVAVSSVVVRPTSDAAGKVQTVSVSATGPSGAVRAEGNVGEWPTIPAPLALKPGLYDTFTVTVTGAHQVGIGPVGISEISIPGVSVRKLARMPVRLTRTLRELGSGGDALVASAPLDVVMDRRSGVDELTEEEPRLERDFALPDDRLFTVRGHAALAGGVMDERIDALGGVGGEVVASSSSRAGSRPQARASAALDGSADQPDLNSGWSPSDPVVGEWLRADFPERRMAGFTVTQAGASVANRVWVRVNDGDPFEARLGPGTTTVKLPETASVRSVQVIILETQGSGTVRITDLGLPRIKKATTVSSGCHTVSSIDGRPLRVRFTGNPESLLAGASVPFVGCDSLTLEEGKHQLRSVPDLVVDDLHLSQAGAAPAAQRSMHVKVVDYASDSMRLRVEDGCSPCYVSSGQGFHPGWRASVDGVDVGAPMVVNGFAAGWRVEAAGGSIIELRYGPARWSWVAWTTSLLAILAALLLIWRPNLLARASRHSPPSQVASRQRGAAGRPVRVLIFVLGVLGVYLSVGPVPALVVAGLCVVHLARGDRSHLMGAVALILGLAMVCAWFAGSSVPMTSAAARAQDNWLAHVLGGLAVWIMLLGVVDDILSNGRGLPRDL